jgi:DNA-directed RNA polymerase subunit RPC12/RpoP
VTGASKYFDVEAARIAVSIDSHKLVKTEAKAATETENGNSAYYTCTDCGKFFSDEKGLREIAQDSWGINKLSHKHTMVLTEAKAATDKTKGNTAYYTCSGCGKFFSDKNGTKEIKKNSWVIPVKPKAKGTVIKDSGSSAKYIVTSAKASNPTVRYIGSTSKKAKTITVPASIKSGSITYKVTAIGAKAFKDNTKVTKIIVGRNVTNIGKEAFYGCTALTKITLGTGVTAIDAKAFYNCSSLTSLTFPAKTTTLGKQFAAKCGKLRKLTVGSKKMKKETVANGAFTGFNSSATITVPSGKVNSYTTLFRKKGLSKKVKIKKSKK